MMVYNFCTRLQSSVWFPTDYTYCTYTDLIWDYFLKSLRKKMKIELITPFSNIVACSPVLLYITGEQSDRDTMLILKLSKTAPYMSAWKLVSNCTFFCSTWKEKLFWGYKLWLSWKQCVIFSLACSDVGGPNMWVSEIDHSQCICCHDMRDCELYVFFYSLMGGHMVEPLFRVVHPSKLLCLVWVSLGSSQRRANAQWNES